MKIISEKLTVCTQLEIYVFINILLKKTKKKRRFCFVLFFLIHKQMADCMYFISNKLDHLFLAFQIFF